MAIAINIAKKYGTISLTKISIVVYVWAYTNNSKIESLYYESYKPRP